MPEPDYLIRQGDTGETITDTLEDENSDPVDIEGATIRFHLAPISGNGTSVLDVSATNAQSGDGTDGSMGKVSYTWSAGNTGVSGLYLGEWQVTFTGGAVQTFPNDGYVLVRVTEQVA